VPADKLWGAQTQRSLEHFSIGKDLIPREMITAYAILKKAAAMTPTTPAAARRPAYRLIVRGLRRNSRRPASRHVPAACLDDRQRHPVQHERERGDLQPLLPARRHAARQQDAGSSERSRQHVAVVERYVSVGDVHRRRGQCEAAPDSGGEGAARCDRGEGEEWNDIVKIGRTHMQDATPLTLGQEWSGYAGMLADDLERIETR
jgi:fumarate hydratase class II